MGERRRYVSYLDKPYKQREFCTGQTFCPRKCRFKLTKADKRKLDKLKKQRVDYRDYKECEYWRDVELFLLKKKMRLAIIKTMEIN